MHQISMNSKHFEFWDQFGANWWYIKSTCLKLLKCPEIYKNMENGVSRHGGGKVQLMVNDTVKEKEDSGRSGKMVAARNTMF